MKIISAGHIERASVSESSDYENCSSSDDSLGTDVGHLPIKLYITHALCNRRLCLNVINSSTLWVSSQTADRPRSTTTDRQQWFVEMLFLRI